jgi:hypothetical protein
MRPLFNITPVVKNYDPKLHAMKMQRFFSSICLQLNEERQISAKKLTRFGGAFSLAI